MKTLLVANRAEIASRVFRTARSMGIRTVAVFSDADAALPFVGDADEAVRLPGAAPADTYLSVERILDAVRRTGADAVHPGYGFLSENASFARACAEAGVAFVGPSPESIEAMGSKIAAKELMTAADVPVLPGVTIDTDLAAGGSLDVDAILADVALPVLVKASFGGGGRGMRVVRSADELTGAVESAQREAASAFGDGTVFVERFVEDPRHVEVQIIGDRQGTMAHLFERECSIQRRYQKIVEESPSPAVDPALRRRLTDAALRAARALRYEGVGTVEFVLAPDGSFFFLEVNTRLQVEHPVTELVTGLDLVELQLRVARGEALPSSVLEAEQSGHAVEVRLYAEDVAASFAPMSGQLDRFRLGPSPADQAASSARGVRVDAGYETGSVVSTHYDAMLAKVIGWGPDRATAIAEVARTLRAARVHGPPTNLDLLLEVLTHPAFERGETDTGFLERHDCTSPSVDEAGSRFHAVAATLAMVASRRTPLAVPVGWRNVWTAHQRERFDEHDVDYRFGRTGLESVRVDGLDVDVELHGASADRVDLSMNGVRRVVTVHRVDETVYVDSAIGGSVLHAVERLPQPDAQATAGSLLAPMPGTVVRVDVQPGDQVSAGAVLVVIEAMKMEHAIRAGGPGEVREVRVEVGAQVDGGTVLVVLAEPDDEGSDG